MSRADLVLLHAPSVYDFRERSIMSGPVSDMVPSTSAFEMYPLGFTTMAEHLERNGLLVRIVNLAGLMVARPDFDASEAVRRLDPVAFGVDLHWLPHAHGSIEVARIVKRHHPDTPVIFGGLSSSFFADELIRYDCVDYVLRGDSTEEPLRLLMEALKRGGSVDDIPNLTWKDASGAVRSNPIDWVPRDMNAISLDYTVNMRGVMRYRDIRGIVPFKGWLEYPVCAALTCHGCSHSCVTCGGSAHAFREHYNRHGVAFRDPELIVRDVESVQRYLPGPVFVLNDFQQAGTDYVRRLIEGLGSIKLRNPVGFEFFVPPSEEFYELLDANLDDYSVEVSVDSHDDAVREAGRKPRYTMAEIEESIAASLRHGCKRFDLYFMSGIPTQTAASVMDTVEYVRGLYDRLGNDHRFLPFISPMAPFLDPGSIGFDHPAEHGYTLLAHTLEEHRQLLVQPSWRYIMNYESSSLPKAELVESTYAAAAGINRLKGEIGAIPADVAATTEARIGEAVALMRRIDGVMEQPIEQRESGLAALRSEVAGLNESTVCEKTELNYPAHTDLRNIINLGAFWWRETTSGLRGRRDAGPASPVGEPEAEQAGS